MLPEPASSSSLFPALALDVQRVAQRGEGGLGNGLAQRGVRVDGAVHLLHLLEGAPSWDHVQYI